MDNVQKQIICTKFHTRTKLQLLSFITMIIIISPIQESTQKPNAIYVSRSLPAACFLLAASLAYSSSLKMEAVHSPKHRLAFTRPYSSNPRSFCHCHTCSRYTPPPPPPPRTTLDPKCDELVSTPTPTARSAFFSFPSSSCFR
jgi:hypothetical protein